MRQSCFGGGPSVVLALLATVHTGCFASAPNEMELYPTLGATDTVVTLSGVDFFTSSTIYCRIGKRMVLAEQNINVTGYGFIILCKAPRQSSGFHSVEITRNGRDFTNSGLVFQYVDVMIDSVFPQHVDPTGGTLVAVRGGGFQDGCYCDSGSATVIAAFSSSALLTCEVGAMIEDSIKDSKLYLSISVSRTQVAHQPYALQVAGAFEVKGVIRRMGIDRSQTDELFIQGNSFNALLQNIWCKIGSILVIGQPISKTRCICILPYTQTGTYPLQISSNKVDFASTEGTISQRHCVYNIYVAPLFFRSQGGVGLMSSKSRMSCNFGEVHALVDAFREIRCSSSTLQSAFESVEVISSAWCAGNQHTIEVREAPTSLLALPAFGVQTGGSLHFVFGTEFVSHIICNFNDLVSHSERISSVLVVCEAPASNSWDATCVLNIGALPEQTKYAGIGNILVLVHMPAIRLVSPHFGSVDGGNALHIVAEFNRRESVFACQLSSIKHIAARWLSFEKVECITPARQNKHADVFISVGPILETWSTPLLYGQLSRDTSFNDVHHSNAEIVRSALQHAGEEDVIDSQGGNIPAIATFDAIVPSIGWENVGIVIMLVGFNVVSNHDLKIFTGLLCIMISSVLSRCELQAHNSSSTIVACSVHNKCPSVSFVKEPSLQSISPDSCGTDGGAIINVFGSHLKSGELACRFANIYSIPRHYSESLLRCIVPAHAPVNSRFSISHAYASLTGTFIWFQYTNAHAVLHSSPSVVKSDSSNGGTALEDFQRALPLLPVHSIESPSTRSEMHAYWIDEAWAAILDLRQYEWRLDSGTENLRWAVAHSCHHLSSTLLKCVSVGTHTILLSALNDSVLHLFQKKAVNTSVRRIMPSSGVFEGGKLVTVTTQGELGIFGMDIAVDSIRPIASRSVGDGTLDFVSPAHRPGRALVKMSVSPGEHSNAGQAFEYVVLSQLRACAAIFADDLEVEDATLVGLQSATLLASGVHHMNDRYHFWLSEVYCAAGYSLHAVIASHAQIHMLFTLVNKTPEVLNVLPCRGTTEGGAVRVFGKAFRSRDFCMLGRNIITHIYFISSALIFVEMPGEKVGDLDFKVTVGDGFLGATYSYIEMQPGPREVFPSAGPVEGGTVLSFNGNWNSNSMSFGSMQGTIGHVSTRRFSEMIVQCVSVSRQSGVVPIQMGYSMDLRSINAVMFTYRSHHSDYVETTLQLATPGFPLSSHQGHAVQIGELPTSFAEPMAADISTQPWAGFMAIETKKMWKPYVYGPAWKSASNTIFSIAPTQVPAAGSVPIIISGTELHVVGQAVAFGDILLNMQVISSAMVRGATPPHSVGRVILNLFLSPVKHAYILTSVESTTVSSVWPSSVSVNGGNILTIKTREALTVYACYVANIGPIVGMRTSTQNVECVAPAHEPGSVIVNPVFSSHGCEFADKRVWYLNMGQVQSANSHRVSSSEPFTFTVSRYGLGHRSHIECSRRVPQGSMIPHESNFGACVVVYNGDEGFGVAQVVGYDGVVTIEYAAQVNFGALFPRDVRAEVGVIFWLAGCGFQKYLHQCEINYKLTRARTISSALLTCEVPSTENGSIQVHIRSGAGMPNTSKLITVDGKYLSDFITPSHGSSLGGEVLRVEGSSFVDSPLLICGAQHYIHVVARWLDGENIECISPSYAQTGHFQFRVGLLGSGFGISKVKFTYGREDEIYWQSASFLYGISPVQTNEVMCGRCLIAATKNHDALNVPHGNFIAPVRPHPCSTGYVQIQLDATTSNSSHADAHAIVNSNPSVMHISPEEGIFGQFITLHGVGFEQHNPICNFAGNIIRADYVSSSIIKCGVENMHTYFDVVVVDVGVRLDLSFPMVSLAIYNGVHLIDAYPSTGCSNGGNVLNVQGRGSMPRKHRSCKVGSIAPIAASQVSVIAISGTFHSGNPPTVCRVGSIAPIAASQVSVGAVECVSPAHTVDVVDIRVGFHGNGYSSESFEYTYMTACALQAVIPSKGPARGEFEVTLHEVFRSSKVALCEVLGGTPVVASPWSSALSCLMRASIQGFFSIKVMHNVELDSEDVVFEYFAPSWLKSLLPKNGMQSGGTLVTLTGVGIGVNGLGCSFGGHFASGVLVSSAIFVCETPALWKLLATYVTVASTVRTHRDDGLELVVMLPVSFRDIFPDRGLSEGGTLVTVTTQGELGIFSVDIAVDSIRPIASRSGGDGTLHFVSPTHRPKSALVKMSMSPGEHNNAGQAFEYVLLSQLRACAANFADDLKVIGARFRGWDTAQSATLGNFHMQCSDLKECGLAHRSVFHHQHMDSFVWHLTSKKSTSGCANHAVDASTQEMEQTIPAQIVSFFPRTIATTGGVITFYGEGFSQRTFLHNAGAGVATSQLVSSVLIRTEIAAGISGEYLRSLLLVSKHRAQGEKLIYEDEANAASVQPVYGTLEGGTVLIIAGESFADSLRFGCTIGAFTSISGRWMDSNIMECISPSHQGEVVAISVSNGSPVLAGSVTYSYQATSLIISNSMQNVHLVYADAMEGGCGDYAASGQPIVSTRNTMQRVTSILEMAQVMTHMSMCSTPFKRVGFVAVVLDGVGRGVHDDIQFQYVLGSLVRSIVPMHIDSGRHHSVTVFGKEFNVATSSCMVDEQVLDTLILSSAMVICEVPNHVDGDAKVVVGRQPGTGNVGMVTFFRHMRVVEIVPSSGPEAGGTVIVVNSLSEKESPLQCRFGSIGPLATRTTSTTTLTTAYQCTAPSHRASLSFFFSQLRYSSFSVHDHLLQYVFLHIPLQFVSMPLSLPLCGRSSPMCSADHRISADPRYGSLTMPRDCFMEFFLNSITSSGFQTVELCKYFHVDMHFFWKYTIDHIFPYTVIANSPHPYTVYGNNFYADNCNIFVSSNEIRCNFQSSCIITCTAILDADSQSGARSQLSVDQARLSMDVVLDIGLHSLHTKEGNCLGGYVIAISGTFHSGNPPTVCRVGSIAPIAASQVSVG
eukprot:CAMPEP_0197613480 /NCGR_PEP_ID=MMETSP1326-20131121/59038_1 /TAXON_ID=1155430 /ORGANISM="Genus nov. species nov., Strain RCC2288" /LENGTH=2966 /DNA_ID=CAMNT_0043182343 /DNA_START=35 /DNA_END=8931 /DNA_ORIENTATION=-